MSLLGLAVLPTHRPQSVSFYSTSSLFNCFMMSESLFVYQSRDRHDLFNCGAFSETASSGSQSFHRQSFHFTLGAAIQLYLSSSE